MANGDTEKDTTGPAGDKATLDEVLVALQKSLSRVSAASRDVPSENARAIITGVIQFEMSARFDIQKDPKAAEGTAPDLLVHRPNGSLDLKLQGQLETDTRIRDNTEQK